MQLERLTAFHGMLVRPARQLAGLALSVSLLGLLAALPAAPAASAASTPTIKALPAGEVQAVLDKAKLSSLSGTALSEVLAGLPQLKGLEAAAVKKALDQTIGTLAGKGDTLGQLLSGGEAPALLASNLKVALGVLGSVLETLLGGNPIAKLTEALESAGSGEVLGRLVAGSAHPEELLGQVLGSVEPSALQALLGTTLSGEPFTKLSVGELASSLKLTPQGLVEGLGSTLAVVPETALALSSGLLNGTSLSILDGTNGLLFGKIERVVEKTEGEGGGGTGGSGGEGGGTGGSGGTAGSTVINLTTAPVSAPATTPSAGVPATAAKIGKVKVISHRVHGQKATVVVQVPSAGALSTTARGLRAVRREAARASRITLHLALTRAGVASVRRHKHIKVALHVKFKPAAGSASSATVALSFG